MVAALELVGLALDPMAFVQHHVAIALSAIPVHCQYCFEELANQRSAMSKDEYCAT